MTPWIFLSDFGSKLSVCLFSGDSHFTPFSASKSSLQHLVKTHFVWPGHSANQGAQKMTLVRDKVESRLLFTYDFYSNTNPIVTRPKLIKQVFKFRLPDYFGTVLQLKQLLWILAWHGEKASLPLPERAFWPEWHVLDQVGEPAIGWEFSLKVKRSCLVCGEYSDVHIV